MEKITLNKWVNGFIFVITMWLLSRLVIIVAMQLIAPFIASLHHTLPAPSPASSGYPMPLGSVPGFVPTSGWELFSHWDGAWYRKIATSGYDYANDGWQHSVEFFPLFPLITRGVMTLGLPFEVAGTFVNNLAFLGALLLLYRWAKECHGISAARWATAVLAWCPFSLFGTVIYTEGLFLLLTTAALQAFEKRQHARAALWGAMATATRPTGSMLVPTFLLVAWKERRPTSAYIAGLATSGGLLLFFMYCAIRFADPLAFVHVQRAWQQPNWLNILADALNLFKDGHVQRTWQQPNGLNILWDALNLVKDSWIKIVMVFGGCYLLWHSRAKLPLVAIVYGFCSFALLLTSGALGSINRYAFGIVSLSLALGVLLARHPWWGFTTIGWFAVLLVRYSIRFALWQWAG